MGGTKASKPRVFLNGAMNERQRKGKRRQVKAMAILESDWDKAQHTASAFEFTFDSFFDHCLTIPRVIY